MNAERTREFVPMAVVRIWKAVSVVSAIKVTGLHLPEILAWVSKSLFFHLSEH